MSSNHLRTFNDRTTAIDSPWLIVPGCAIQIVDKTWPSPSKLHQFTSFFTHYTPWNPRGDANCAIWKVAGTVCASKNRIGIIFKPIGIRINIIGILGLFCCRMRLELAWSRLKIGQMAPKFCKCAILSPFHPNVKSPDPQPPPIGPLVIMCPNRYDFTNCHF
jgi:hypothetical protein